MTQSGGTAVAGAGIVLGRNADSSGVYTLTGGSLSTGAVYVGYNGTGIFTQSGGSFSTNNRELFLGFGNGSGTYNLNGGTLSVVDVARGMSTATFNFNGGTLQARQDNTFFVQGLTTANVKTGGVRIDTAGYNVTVAQPLVHFSTPGGPAPDGGLTKLGAGTLNLTGNNTYTGATTVSAGTLLVNNAAGSGTGTGAVDVLGGATVGGAGAIGGSLSVESLAILAPGNSAGRLTVGGNVNLVSGAVLQLELGGLTAGTSTTRSPSAAR